MRYKQGRLLYLNTLTRQSCCTRLSPAVASHSDGEVFVRLSFVRATLSPLVPDKG